MTQQSIANWFKQQRAQDREDLVMLLSIIHLGLLKDRFFCVSTEDCQVTATLREGLGVVKQSEEN